MALTAEQIAMRRTGITATDIRILAGLDPHGRTAHDVWVSKVLEEAPLAENDARSIGEELEPIVVRRVAKRRGLTLLPGDTLRSPRYPTHLATPDALEAGPSSAFRSLVQAKVVGYHMMHNWGPDGDDEGVPDYVLVQCAWEAHVTERPVNHVGALLGTELRTYVIDAERDHLENLVGPLIEIADQFWADHVLPKRAPPLDGSEGASRMLRAMFPRNRGPMFRASEQVEEIAKRYFAVRAALKPLEVELEQHEQLLKLATGEAEGIKGDGWRLYYRWREPVDVPAYTRKGFRQFDMRSVNR